MTIVVDGVYLGPYGRQYRVEHIDESCDMRWVTIREVADGTYGSMTFAIEHAPKFLQPLRMAA